MLNKTKISILALFLFVFIFFSPAIFSKDKLLSAADIITTWPLFRLEEKYEPQNNIAGDTLTQFEPWFKTMKESWKNGEIPLWNSFNGGGAPLMGNNVSAVFYPLAFFIMLLPLKWGYLLYYFFKLFFIGLFTFFYFRSIKIRHEFALMGAIAFSFSAFNVAWLFWPHTNVVFLLPLGLFIIEKWIEKKYNWQLLFPLWGIAFAIAFFGGHPETLFHILILVFTYLLFRVYFLKDTFKEKIKLICQWIGSTVLGLGMSAVALLPFAEYLFQSSAWASRNQFTENPFFFHYSLSILQFFPEFFGSQVSKHIIPGIGKAPHLGAPVFNFNETAAGFVGLIILLMAAMGIFNVILALIRKKSISTDFSKLTVFFTVFFLLSFAVVYKLPFVFDFITSLPILKASSNTRLLLTSGFSLIVISVIFLEMLFSKSKKENSSSFIPLAVLIALFAFLYVTARQYWQDVVLPKMPFTEDKVNLIDERQFQIMIAVVLALIGIFILLKLWQRLGISEMYWFFVVLFTIILFAETGLRFITYPNLSPERYFYPQVDILSEAREQSGLCRTTSLGGPGAVYPSNINAMYDLYDIRNYDGSNVKTYDELAARVVEGDWSNHGNLESLPLWYLNMMGVKSVLTHEGKEQQGVLKDFPVVFKQKGKLLLENPSVLPRAYIVYNAVVQSPEEALDTMTGGEFDPGKEVIISDDSFSFQNSNNNYKAASIREYSNNRVVIETDSNKQGVLFLSDIYYPGWKAYVDDIEVPVYRANYAFRSVIVPEGVHQVEFKYQPRSFTIGGIISLVSLLLGILFCYLSIRTKKSQD